jgi:hypothetical protein
VSLSLSEDGFWDSNNNNGGEGDIMERHFIFGFLGAFAFINFENCHINC